MKDKYILEEINSISVLIISYCCPWGLKNRYSHGMTETGIVCIVRQWWQISLIVVVMSLTSVIWQSLLF